MTDAVIPELDVPFTFRKRPVPVPADLRPEWRVGIVLLLLRKCCRQNRASFSRLHVLNWAARTPINREALLNVINGTASPESIVVRLEPALNRAVDIAHGFKLVTRVAGDRIELTEMGVSVAEEIMGHEALYQTEQAFIDKIGRDVTEALVDRLFNSYKGT